MVTKIFGLAGWSGSGKTTLMEKLVAELVGRGVKVSTVKHAHAGFDMDRPGKDSYRHREAGATEVLVTAPHRWALLHELRDEAEPGLEALMAHLSPVDLVLIEGFKTYPHPKVEVHRPALGKPQIWPDDPTIEAVASDCHLSGLTLPWFDLDDAGSIATFILARTGIAGRG